MRSSVSVTWRQQRGDKSANAPFRVNSVRVREIAVLDALAAVKDPSAAMAQWTLEQIRA